MTATQPVSLAAMWTGHLAVSTDWQVQLLTELTHPPNLSTWYADDQRMGRNILGHNRARTHESELSDRDAADHRAIRAERSTALDQRVEVLAFPLDQGARIIDVGEDHAGTTEHAFLQRNIVV